MSREVLHPPLDALLEAHARFLERYGGSAGLRGGLGELAAALARAEQLRAYAEAEPGVEALAAAVGYAIARIRHPFVDNNKRTAFYATVATLWMNGRLLDADEEEAADVFERVASGELDEPGLVAWLERNSAPGGVG